MGKLYGPLGQWCPDKYHHAEVCKWSLIAGRANYQPHGLQVTCMGLGNAYTRLIAYVVIQVQVDRVQGYDEDQIALVILNLILWPRSQ